MTRVREGPENLGVPRIYMFALQGTRPKRCFVFPDEREDSLRPAELRQVETRGVRPCLASVRFQQHQKSPLKHLKGFKGGASTTVASQKVWLRAPSCSKFDLPSTFGSGPSAQSRHRGCCSVRLPPQTPRFIPRKAQRVTGARLTVTSGVGQPLVLAASQ